MQQDDQTLRKGQMVETLLVFLAIYYRVLWQYEVTQNDQLQDQKAKLYRRVIRYRRFIRGRDPNVTDLQIQTIENHECR